MATACVGLNSDLYDAQSFQKYAQVNLSGPNYREASSELPVITTLSDNNVILMLLFSQKQAVEWDQFKAAAGYHLRAKDDDLEALKSILDAESGIVNSNHFAKFLKWFTPLVPEADTNIRRQSSAWKISNIASLIRQPWFHGFAADAYQRLNPCVPGTFLVRFSSQAPHFILALKEQYCGQVVELRVLSMSGTVRLNDSERFADLQQLVDNYSKEVPVGASCILQSPCSRC